MYTRILVGTDLSADADRAITVAHGLAKRDGGTLAVCHVMPPLQPVNMLFPQAVAPAAFALADIERRARDAVAARLSSVLGADAESAAIFIDSGTDYAELVSRGEHFKADLLVVASHGNTGMKRAVLGGVSDKVVRYAHSSTLVVRPGENAGPIVAATDLSDASMVGVHAAAEEARRRSVDLVIVFAVDALSYAAPNAIANPLGIGGGDAGADAFLATAQAALDAKLAEAKVGAKAEVVQGRAAAAVVQRVEELEASLLVVATHGRTGLRRVLLGSVAEAIVRHAPCTTLVARS